MPESLLDLTKQSQEYYITQISSNNLYSASDVKAAESSWAEESVLKDICNDVLELG